MKMIVMKTMMMPTIYYCKCIVKCIIYTHTPQGIIWEDDDEGDGNEDEDDKIDDDDDAYND